MQVTKTRRRLVLGLSLLLARSLSAQQAATISVTGAVAQPLTLTAADLGALPRATASISGNGMTTTYEGVWVSDVLKKAGVPIGSLRGASLSTYVIASASDGYQVLFSIAELDPEMTEGKVLLADKANGQSLFGEQGSFRLVTPNDKRGARGIRMLTSLNVVQLKK
jgi:hypothetical protein